MELPVIILIVCLSFLAYNIATAVNRQKRINELSKEWHTLNKSFQAQLRNLDDYRIHVEETAVSGNIGESMEYATFAMDDFIKSNTTFIKMSQIHTEIVRLKALNGQ